MNTEQVKESKGWKLATGYTKLERMLQDLQTVGLQKFCHLPTLWCLTGCLKIFVFECHQDWLKFTLHSPSPHTFLCKLSTQGLLHSIGDPPDDEFEFVAPCFTVELRFHLDELCGNLATKKLQRDGGDLAFTRSGSRPRLLAYSFVHRCLLELHISVALL